MRSIVFLKMVTAWEEANKTAPIGMKTIPTIKKVVITGIGVKIGCQAFKFCCLKGVSRKTVNYFIN